MVNIYIVFDFENFMHNQIAIQEFNSYKIYFQNIMSIYSYI
jgi:hypothetical protein